MTNEHPSSRAQWTPSWDTQPPGQPGTARWVVLAVALAVPALVGTTLRLFPPSADGPALVASFIPYAIVLYLLCLVCVLVALVRARRRRALGVMALVVAGLLALHVAWLGPLFRSDHRVASTRTFTLMSLNMRKGVADTGDVMREGQSADVVVFLEATSRAINGLRYTWWDDRFPYSVGVGKYLAGDTVVYSRFPLHNTTPLPQSAFQQWATTVEVPGIGGVRLIAAHPCNPFCGSDKFAVEHARLRTAADANLQQPLIVVGDLNATDDHGAIRELKRDGLESVTDIVGAGWLPTYPANSVIPPLIPIDHILVNHFLTATSVTRFKVAATDHLGLVAQIAGAG